MILYLVGYLGINKKSTFWCNTGFFTQDSYIILAKRRAIITYFVCITVIIEINDINNAV
jgi:hypothetical protein